MVSEELLLGQLTRRRGRGQTNANQSQLLLGRDPDYRPRVILDDLFDLLVDLLQSVTLDDGCKTGRWSDRQ